MVAALALLILLVAFNLSGLFEVGTSLQGLGSGLAAAAAAWPAPSSPEPWP